MLVYDNQEGTEVFLQRHLPPSYWRRIDTQELDLVKINTCRLEQDIVKAWGSKAGLHSITHIVNGHLCTTSSDAYHGKSPHQHHDLSPKSAQAKRNDYMFERFLKIIKAVLAVLPLAFVVTKNLKSKSFPRLLGVQRVLGKEGWQLTVGPYCANAEQIDGGPWAQKDTLYLTYNAKCPWRRQEFHARTMPL